MSSSRDPKHRIAGLVAFLHRYFIWLIVGSYVIAAPFPAFGRWIRGVDLGHLQALGGSVELSLPLIMLAILLFNAGLGTDARELRGLIRAPRVLIAGQLGNLLVPLGFILGLSAVMRMWHNPEEVQQILVGLALVASMPIAGASTAWSQNANGNLALSLGLVLLTTLLSPLLTPLVLHAVGFVTTGVYSESLHRLASGGVGSFLGIWVILPSLLGIGARMLLGDRRVELVKPHVKLLNYAVLVLLNYANASLTLPQAVANPDWDFLGVILAITTALCFTAFAAGHLLARTVGSDAPSRVALMFGLGMNNNGTGLVLASVALADHPAVMLPIIFYNLVQHLVASIINAVIFRRRAPVTPSACSSFDATDVLVDTGPAVDATARLSS